MALVLAMGCTSESALAASTGSITVASVSGSQATVTASVQHDCAGAIYCGWFASIRQTTPNAACAIDDTNDPLWWVGAVTEQPSASYTVVQQPYGWYAGQQPVRFCLTIYDGGAEQVLATTTWTPPPAPAPAPSPPPATPAPTPAYTGANCGDFTYQEQAQRVYDSDPTTNSALDANGDGVACSSLPHEPVRRAQTMTSADATHYVRSALRHTYGGRFTHRSAYSATCHRLSRIRFRCAVSWQHSGGLWRGSVTLWTSIERGTPYINWAVNVHRATQAPNPSVKPPTSPPTPSYPGCVTPENPSNCVPPPNPYSPPADFCNTHECIANFPNGRGYAEQCNDGEWSMSGGLRGACSQHGGESGYPR